MASEPKCNSGTKEPRLGTSYCDTCERHVTSDECGTSLEHVMDFAVTCSWPCKFPNGLPPKGQTDGE